MDILMVAAEHGPYVRQTDAADAVASLAKALRQLGHDVTVALPRHPSFEAGGLMVARRLTPLSLPGGGEITVFDVQLPSGVQLSLFDAPVLFDRPGVYGEAGTEYPDNAKRFSLLSQAAAALVHQRAELGKAFDIVHLHDCAAALVPSVLRRAPGPVVPTVLTIHDGTRQCVFDAETARAQGVSEELLADESLLDGTRLNALQAGILGADALTTVSPSYARELSLEQRSGRLATTFAQLDKPIVGVTNGVDYAVYNPATDPVLASRYDAEDPSNKGRSKSALLRQLELELELERPLFVAFDEPGADKAIELVIASLPALLKADLSLVIAGRSVTSGEKKLESARQKYRDRFALMPDLDAASARRLYAAADFVLVPSRHEPCGLAQLVAQRYGAVPIARATGGIVDTVTDCDAALETGTGWLFDEDSGLIGAVARALAAYRSPAFPRLVRRIMRRDLGWDRPARRYLQIYRQTIGATA
jgi:starch synthase